MTAETIEHLNTKFSLDGENYSLNVIPGFGDIPLIEVQNEFSTATISLQGAHVLSWVPYDEEEVIWLSDDVTFARGKSVRGGIPICWPWFGAYEANSAFPAHGFARTVLWQIIETQQLSSGETLVTFKLDTQQLAENLQTMWPWPTVAEYRLTIGKRLQIELTTFNQSDETITIGQALHTYFKVDDISQTTISGLEGKDYLDKTEGFKRKTQSGAVSINAEVDRIYLNSADDVVINDQKRKIVIKKQGSQSTVVWNPWQEVAEKMGDLGQDGYREMLCVESANAADDTITIQAGESFTLQVSYEVENI